VAIGAELGKLCGGWALICGVNCVVWNRGIWVGYFAIGGGDWWWVESLGRRGVGSDFEGVYTLYIGFWGDFGGESQILEVCFLCIFMVSLMASVCWIGGYCCKKYNIC
jgi:hypothetical protein